ncbi:thioredoxin fold domain-containing protein [Vibrio sp. PNB22_3_1]
MKALRVWVGLSAALVSSALVASEKNDLEQALTDAGVLVVDVRSPKDLQGLNLTSYVTSMGLMFYDKKKNVVFDSAPYLFNKGQSQVMPEYKADLLNKIGGKVVYQAQNEKARITVFTDFTCPWCTKVHEELDQYLAAGVTVEYVPYPRNGEDDEVARVMSGILKSDDPNKAFNMAFARDERLLDLREDEASLAVKTNLAVIRSLGVNSTPTFFINGMVIDRYVPAENLIELALLDAR